MLVAWASIERHILVFHQNLIATKAQRFLVHYLPLIIFSIYPFIYYIIIFFVLPCNTSADYTQQKCYIDSCIYSAKFLGQWDNIVNNASPILIIVIFSLALLARIWYSKYRVRQRFQWKNYRKMTIQLLSVSVIYFILYFPTIFIYTIYIAGVKFDGIDDFSF